MHLNIGNEISDDYVWFDFSDDIQLQIGRAGSVEFLRAKEEVEKRYKKQIAKDTLPAEKTLILMHKAVAKAILVDWKGIKDGKKDFPYSEDNAVLIFQKYPSVFSFVIDMAAEDENFEIQQVEDTAKKSAAQLSGV